MKKKILSAVLSAVLILSIGCYAATPESVSEPETYGDIFEKDKIINVNIEIDEADLRDMYDHATNEEYHSANVTINGVTVENAGIRTKGNMTLSSVVNSDSDRYSFRIKFNKYVKGQTFLGLDELCLNNGYSDASYMREYLHYEILEELGMNVPKRSYCNVYINGELFGFYLAVEALDDTFMEREFGENYENGNLYKMDQGSTLEYKEDENYTYADRKSGPDKELADFKAFVKKLNDVTDGEKGDIESFLNVESALKYIASNTVLCNYDSYNGNNHHNFYLYEDENGVFTVVPWDFNMSFGGFGGNNSSVGIDTPVMSGSIDRLPLIGKLLSIDEYKEQYYGYIEEIVSMLGNFEERVTELKEIIKPYVENDPTAFYSVDDFEKATSVSEKDGEEKAPENEAFDKEMPENAPEKPDGGRRGGGQPFGGNDSIIDCIKDRIENINAQFAGTAEKSTQTEGHGGRPGGGFDNNRSPEFGGNPGGMQPPELGENGENPGNMQPPENQNPGDFQNRPTSPRDDGNRPGGNFGGRHDDKANNDTVRVHVNGHIISFDVSPFIENDTTLVGFRAILEALGANVEWNEETQTVTAEKEDTSVVLNIGSDTAYVNGTAHTLLTAPVISDGSTMIPVRFISEQLGMKVSWDGDTKLITVTSK